MSETKTAPRANWKIIGILAVVAAMIAVLLPGGFAAGSDGDSPIPGGDPSVVLLTLGKQDKVTWGETGLQNITTKKNDCLAVTFAPSDALLEVTPFGGSLGFVKDGFGVQSAGDGSGEPCGRIEAADGEAISVTLGTDLDDYLMTAIDVDLELKFNAIVDVIYLHEGNVVDTGTFDPISGSDDGPDSKDGDNYRYFFEPVDDQGQLYFDEVKFVADSGSFSLEGGADGTDDGVLETGDNSSQFQVIRTFDGQITCGDIVPISVAGVPVSGLVTMHSLSEGGSWSIDPCPDKVYDDGVTDSSLFFIPQLEDTDARYTIVITAVDQTITAPGIGGEITSLAMEYSRLGDFSDLEDLLACEAQPVLLDDNPSPTMDAYEAFWERDDVGLLPFGESACYYEVSLTPTGAGVGTEVWKIFFEDDPGFSFN